MAIASIIAGIALVICFFLLGRDLTCWYFKINERIKLREETNQLLRRIIDGQSKN